MFSRILVSTFAAAAVAAAAPALAHDPAAPGGAPVLAKDVECGDVQRCCGSMGTQINGATPSHPATQQATPSSGEKQQRGVGDDPQNRSQDFGG